MPEPLVFLLLGLALLLPLMGAVALRLLDSRLGDRGLFVGAAAIFGIAIISALALSQSDVGALRIGDLSLLLPGTRPGDGFALPADVPVEGTPLGTPVGPPVLPTLTPRPTLTPTPSATPEPSATATATPEPPTATPEPPTATPEPPAGGRRYTVASGDSLRSIAEKFSVSVEAILQANNLTPAQGDALRVGQELVIP
jgi:LysM repeat protein